MKRFDQIVRFQKLTQGYNFIKYIVKVMIKQLTCPNVIAMSSLTQMKDYIYTVTDDGRVS